MIDSILDIIMGRGKVFALISGFILVFILTFTTFIIVMWPFMFYGITLKTLIFTAILSGIFVSVPNALIMGWFA